MGFEEAELPSVSSLEFALKKKKYIKNKLNSKASVNLEA